MSTNIQIETGVPFQFFKQSLDGRDFNLQFNWNFRREVWGMVVKDSDDNVLYSINSLLLEVYIGLLATHNLDYPQGIFIITDTQGENKEATLDSLSVRHKLTFFTKEEILEIL